jgi:drug/metabolite transporter (DMT)-like permease
MPARARVGIAGLGLTLTSAVLMSALGITTQLAYDAGATVGTLLSGRFLVAAAILWPLVWIMRRRRPAAREVVLGLLLGAGYSLHAWLFSASLTRLDAGLVDVLLFTYPALVLLGAVALRRERWSTRRMLATTMATAGTALVLLGGLGSIEPLGASLALGSAVAYAAYILCSVPRLEQIDPMMLTALVTSGAALTLTAAGAAQSEVVLEADASAFALIGIVGLVAVAGMGTFVAGIGRLGPSRASVVSAVQPVLTPVLGLVVFGDLLGPAQVLGGALVVAAVVILEVRDAVPGAAWLPDPERRTLARLADAVDVPAGRSVVRQGAPADAFFLIESGRASVDREARHLAVLGPGDFFGEVALLRGGTRTASVRAATDMRVRVIGCCDFPRAMKTLPTLARSVRAAARERHGRSTFELAMAG